MKIVDLSRELYHRTPSYPGHPPIIHGTWKDHGVALEESGNVWGLASMFISMADHGGTHIDAPRHFGRRAFPSTSIRWKNASCRASALISVTSHRRRRLRPPISKPQ
jgi:kynurenine formamidase